jgi:hypothetical protein
MIQYTKQYIEQLLDKFMAGTSTLEEEDILSQYFAQDCIPTEWEQYRLLFAELEAMKPSVKSKRIWLRWSIAAAFIGVVFATMLFLNDKPAEPMIADNKTVQTDSVKTEVYNEKSLPDTTVQQGQQFVPQKSVKRRKRKMEPTIHDYDKAYALMAQAEQEQMEAKRQIEQAQREIIEAQLAAYGYIPVMQEDGTIIYTNEQTEFIAYEE